jgi:signal transduction histidine kinase
LILGLNLTITSLLFFLSSYHTRRIILEDTEKRGISMAKLFGDANLNYLKSYNFQGIQQNALTVKTENHLSYLIVYNKEGLIAAHTAQPSFLTSRATGLDELAAMHSNSPYCRELDLHEANSLPFGQTLDCFVPLKTADLSGFWGTIRLGISVEEMENRIREVQIQVLEICLVSLVASVIGSAYLAKRITTPIDNLVKGAQIASSGDLSYRIHIHTHDELESLANDFNHMLEQLSIQQEEKIRSEKLAAVGTMVNTIVHDCRTPIAVIKGFSSLLVDFSLPPANQQECLGLINFEVERMERMMDELLQYSTEKKVPLHLEAKKTDDFMRECLAEIRVLFRGTTVEIVENINSKSLINIDQDKFRRAILNIVANARDALKGRGSLTLKTGDCGTSSMISIADTAGGIPESVQIHIFDPFFTHGKKSGFGLGMAITKKIIEDHGGEITLKSQLGVGTEFEIRLPVLDSTTQENNLNQFLKIGGAYARG